jgi:hypothetical protein
MRTRTAWVLFALLLLTNYTLQNLNVHNKASSFVDSCYSLSENRHNYKKPVLIVSTAGQLITISVTMYRQSYENRESPVYYKLDTELSTNKCITSGTDQIMNSANLAWTHSSNGCADTYTVTQSVINIVHGNRNNWKSEDGKTYSLPIYASYSVNSGSSCYFVGYKFLASFRAGFNMALASADFVSSDSSFKFSLSGLRVTTTNDLVIEGNIMPTAPNELQSIALQKVDGANPFTSSSSTCSDSTIGCEITFTAALSSLGAAGQDISGVYETSADVYQSAVLTSSGVTLTMTLSYVVSSDPIIIDSDTITTTMKVYSENTYTTERSTAVTSAQTLYVENAISESSPAIPALYRLRMSEGYLCCVPYPSSITPYNVNFDSGGCKDPNGKTEYVNLGTEGTHDAGIIQTSADSANPKRYRLQIALGTLFSTTNHPNALTCQVLLISKFGVDVAQRSIANNVDSALISIATIRYKRIDDRFKPWYVFSASHGVTTSQVVALLSTVMFLILQ